MVTGAMPEPLFMKLASNDVVAASVAGAVVVVRRNSDLTIADADRHADASSRTVKKAGQKVKVRIFPGT
jgi:hypothetical protein